MPQALKTTLRPQVRHMAVTRVRRSPLSKSAATAKPAVVKPMTAKISAAAKPLAKTGGRAKPAAPLQGARQAALMLFAPFAVLLFMSLLLIGLRVSVGQLAKKAAELEARTVQLQDENNLYLARAEHLASYSRIARLAHERLGLVGLAPKLIVVSSE